ncbi:MAG: hypothetical protein ACOYN5_08295 [Bacteroidales bacterium]
MKTKQKFLILFVIVCSIATFTASAQEYRTIFDSNKPLHISGFGGPLVEFSGVNDEFAVSSGGGGAMIVNNLFFGGYGIGLSTFHYKDIILFDAQSGLIRDFSNVPVSFGHGGFWIGGMMHPAEAIHLACSAKIGWGSISLYEHMDPYASYNSKTIEDVVFVMTPQIEAEFNLARWFKVNVGVGYRIVSGTDLEYEAYNSDLQYIGTKKYFNNKEFNSFTGTISFLFGGFEPKSN